MNTPKIKGLGITPHWSSTRWKATGDVDGVGWLEARGTSLIGAMEALQALPAQRGASTGAPSMFTTCHPVDLPDTRQELEALVR